MALEEPKLDKWTLKWLNWALVIVLDLSVVGRPNWNKGSPNSLKWT